MGSTREYRCDYSVSRGSRLVHAINSGAVNVGVAYKSGFAESQVARNRNVR